MNTLGGEQELDGESADLAGKKVAIVGGARSRVRAPFDDDSWEVWAFSSLRLPTPRITRWFEMHAFDDLKSQLTKKNAKRRTYGEYMKFLQELDAPIYMQKAHDDFPKSVEYPLQTALDAFGRCFTSTASYLIALAILERFDTIGVWGIHLTEKSVYARQRPGVEYLLGVAKERGIEVYLPPRCPLRIPRRPVIPATEVLYGYDWESPKAWWRKRVRRQTRSNPRRGKRR